MALPRAWLLLLLLPVVLVVVEVSATLAPPPPTPDCPHGTDHPCKEPANPSATTPGFTSSNLFWPGEVDSEGMVFECTYCPSVVMINSTTLVALGGCNAAGCNNCNGLHMTARSPHLAPTFLDVLGPASSTRTIPGSPGHPFASPSLTCKAG